MRQIFILLIKFYQSCFSRFTGRCLYKPSCSEYCIIAIEKYGVKNGLIMFWERFKRCDIDHIQDYGKEDYP